MKQRYLLFSIVMILALITLSCNLAALLGGDGNGNGPGGDTGYNEPPTAPYGPNPADGATNVSVTPSLGWSPASDPNGDQVTYDVFLDQNTTPGTKVNASPLYTPSFNVSTALTVATKYYWKVVAKDGKGGETSGPIWSFTTGSSTGASFTVSSSNPQPYATNVAENGPSGNGQFSVTFNNPVDTATVNDANFYLDYSFTTGGLTTVSEHIPGTFTWSGDFRTINFTPNGTYLASNWTYRLNVTTGIKDTDGNPLSSAYSATFTTQDPLGTADLYMNNDFQYTTQGLKYWTPALGLSSYSNLGSMTVFYDSVNQAATLRRTDSNYYNGWMFLGKDFGSGSTGGVLLGSTGMSGYYYVQITVTYWKFSGMVNPDHRLKARIQWSDGPSYYRDVEPDWQVVDSFYAGDGNTAGFVTESTTFALYSVYTYDSFYLNWVGIGQGGWDYETR
ncbi:MAG: Ig-like domain-containing protein, partial [Spirochaetota bacterium]